MAPEALEAAFLEIEVWILFSPPFLHTGYNFEDQWLFDWRSSSCNMWWQNTLLLPRNKSVYLTFVWFVCHFLSKKRLNGWTDRANFLNGIRYQTFKMSILKIQFLGKFIRQNALKVYNAIPIKNICFVLLIVRIINFWCDILDNCKKRIENFWNEKILKRAKVEWTISWRLVLTNVERTINR